MIRLLLILIILFSYTSCLPQENLKKDVSTIRLLKWNAVSCDNTYDPYKLQNRVTSSEKINGVTFITVNFSNNCCAEFKPIIKFKDNKLMLYPYKEYFADICSCYCCFSINFEIEGIETNDYDVYFNDKKIKLSQNHYKTIKPSFKIYNGREINRMNKYGFKEGTWIEFHDNGNQKSITKYPLNSIYYQPDCKWSKRFNESMKLIYFSRKDTTEFWFDDRELRSQVIKYSSGDTIFEKGFWKYENRQLSHKYLERRYPTIITSKFDATYKGTGGVYNYVYNQEYFSNGQPKYLQKKDTSYTWFKNGTIKLKSYKSGKLEYNEKGHLLKRSFYWVEPGVKGWGDLSHSLYFKYRENGDLQKIHFARDEISKDEKSLSTAHYYWKWDKNLNLIEFPEKWKEDYPWEKIKKTKLLSTKYKLH